MIPEGSFLRNIPWVYETQGRMELEAIAFAIDAIYLKHLRIIGWATNCQADTFANITHHERLELFLDLWSIVDQADVLRRLLNKGTKSSVISSFMEVAAPAQSMRNKMDHLAQNIPNLASSKGNITPIYGAFSFGKFELDDKGVDVEDVEIYTVTAGSLTHKSHKWPVPNPSNSGRILDIPVGMLEFSAFDKTLDVSELIRRLHELVHLFDTVIRERIESEIDTLAKDQGLDAELLKSDSAGGIATVLKGKLTDS